MSGSGEENGDTESEYKLPHIDIDYGPFIEKSRDYGGKLYEQFSGLAIYLKDAGVGYFKRKFVTGAVKKLIQMKMESVKPTDLWDSIKSGEDPVKYWREQENEALSENVAEYLQGFGRMLGMDITQHFKEFDQRLAREGGDVIMLTIKDARPDLYNVLMPKRVNYEYEPVGPEKIQSVDRVQGKMREKALKNFEDLLQERDEIKVVRVIGENEIFASLLVAGERIIYKIEKNEKREAMPGAEAYINAQVVMLRRDLRKAIKELG